MAKVDLELLFASQTYYNSLVWNRAGKRSAQQWTERYLLGIVSEIDELLRETDWKDHRRSLLEEEILTPNPTSLAVELADILKYVISLAQVNEIKMEEVFRQAQLKTDAMTASFVMESSNPAEGQKVLICDLDGTIADYRASFMKWLNEHQVIMSEDAFNTLTMDIDIGMQYSSYARYKDQFEREGGYRNLIPYRDAVLALQRQRANGVYIFMITARPTDISNVWLDTFSWLQANDIIPNRLGFGRDERLLVARKLTDKGHPVIMWEDDPVLIRRGSKMDIPVYARIQGYNMMLGGENIHAVANYDCALIERMWDYAELF